MIFLFLSIFWLIREIKSVLFWLYLWQLKEYHIGRFLDHFRTEKGKQLLINKLVVLKIVLLFIFFCFYFKFNPFVYFPPFQVQINEELDLPFFLFFILFFSSLIILFILYIFESIRTFYDFFQKRLKKPKLTEKTFVLIFANIFVIILFFFNIFRNFFQYPYFFQLPPSVDPIEIFFIISIWLLIFDIFTPLIVSAIVLIFQPLAVISRNRIIAKAKKKREEYKKLLVIGVTGSYGKTSTKEFLADILSEKYNVLKTKEHQNSEIGISQCILNDLNPNHEIFICEMGAYNRGGIKFLCDIVKPKIGILTGINEQHMATFGSQENIIKAKYEMIEALPKNGKAFFNAKNKYCAELYEKTKGIEKFLYGQEAKFFGEENILGAKAVAGELGMTKEEIQKATDKIENKMPGIKIKKGINGFNVIDATYSANPDGVIANLEYLKNNFTGKKVIIMPCLIELGKSSKEVHKRIGLKIGEVCDLAVITTKDRLNEIKGGAVESGMRADNILFMEDPKIIFDKINNFCKSGDVVLLESRVPGYLIKQLISDN